MSSYQVHFVSGDALPGGVEWAFARQGGVTFLFVRESAIDHEAGRCDALTRAWVCWQAAEGGSVRRGLRSFAAV